ncbi:MAG: hypothetical protein M3P49_04655 [Actinomycetota bacterium]|nr:hypothetical protein [Actinomycetota bacterium]
MVKDGRRTRRLTDVELREQRALIDAELEARETERVRLEREVEEASRERARATRARVRQALPSVGEWVEYEYTCCTRTSCKVCGGERYAHGPYWFHYFRRADGRQTSRYVGLVLDARAAEVLAAHEKRQLAREQRAWEAAALRRGENTEASDTPILEAGNLAGLTAQEAYLDEFTAEERADAARRKTKKLARDQRAAPTSQVAPGGPPQGDVAPFLPPS